ncbi:thiopurine S-methyltransferase [Marinobacterium lutimaris]|uniref:Thiopurine S-methyltransferase n=1 Tax=Marinobacterium lutimaris TaxID=568106 RepID=A0A1H5U7Q9_9GAMM|nr:thiopurine S-methyltransferase [Marinobacterium lutimaris]SEF71060.1 thiopurine S-methyltransferase [Marinobacterium lutimaris]
MNDNDLWLSLWRDRDTAFHQRKVNSLLIRFWTELKLPRRSRILVPLCGKSLDMIWLSQQGHEVIGVELSPLAVKTFFKENHIKPSRKRDGQLTLWKHGRLSIYCGDLFQLQPEQLGRIDAIYDRAALTALPAGLRGAYIEHLQHLTGKHSPALLLTTEDRQQNESDQHFQGIDTELSLLCATRYRINLQHFEAAYPGQEKNLSQGDTDALNKVYRLTPLD